MTRSEIIADHIATLRNLASNSDATRARMVFAHAIYAALATPGCEAQGVRLADLPHLAERVAEMADAHERVVGERDAARTLLNLVSEALSGGEAPVDRLPELVFAMGQRFAAAVDARDAARAERDELAATLTALALTDLSGPARHALATADQFGCLMPSYCGSPVADELRRYGLSKASMDPRWEGWEQLTDIGKAVRAAAGVKS